MALLLEILQDFQTSVSGGDIASPCCGRQHNVGMTSFGEPDLRGGHRVDAILEGRGGGRIIIVVVMVNLPIATLEPPVDGRREPKTQWQEGKDGSDQSIVFEHGITVVVAVVAVAVVAVVAVVVVVVVVVAAIAAIAAAVAAVAAVAAAIAVVVAASCHHHHHHFVFCCGVFKFMRPVR
jgi:hypothetical protein